MEQFETIKRTRSILATAPKSKASERTVGGYVKEVERLIGAAKGKAGGDAKAEAILAAARDTTSVNTWHRRRAALLYWVRASLAHGLSQQDSLQRELRASGADLNSDAGKEWRTLVRRLGKLTDLLERLSTEKPPTDRKPRHSKRKDMKRLPEDWRETMVKRLRNYRLAVLAQVVCGCRPAELEQGIQLRISGGYLQVEIAGRKVTDVSGQPWRRLSWPINSASPLVSMLVAEVQGGLSQVKIPSAKAYTGAFISAGRRAFKDRKESISPYCARHAFASDMKAARMSEEEISQALGHCSDVARSFYGHWQMGGGGGVAPKRVEAARLVRVKKVAASALQKTAFC